MYGFRRKYNLEYLGNYANERFYTQFGDCRNNPSSKF